MDKFLKMLRPRDKGIDAIANMFDKPCDEEKPFVAPTFGVDYTKRPKRFSAETVSYSPSNPTSPYPQNRMLGPPMIKTRHSLSPRPEHKGLKIAKAVPGAVSNPWTYSEQVSQPDHTLSTGKQTSYYPNASNTSIIEDLDSTLKGNFYARPKHISTHDVTSTYVTIPSPGSRMAEESHGNETMPSGQFQSSRSSVPRQTNPVYKTKAALSFIGKSQTVDYSGQFSQSITVAPMSKPTIAQPKNKPSLPRITKQSSESPSRMLPTPSDQLHPKISPIYCPKPAFPANIFPPNHPNQDNKSNAETKILSSDAVWPIPNSAGGGNDRENVTQSVVGIIPRGMGNKENFDFNYRRKNRLDRQISAFQSQDDAKESVSRKSSEQSLFTMDQDPKKTVIASILSKGPTPSPYIQTGEQKSSRNQFSSNTPLKIENAHTIVPKPYNQPGSQRLALSPTKPGSYWDKNPTSASASLNQPICSTKAFFRQYSNRAKTQPISIKAVQEAAQIIQNQSPSQTRREPKPMLRLNQKHHKTISMSPSPELLRRKRSLSSETERAIKEELQRLRSSTNPDRHKSAYMREPGPVFKPVPFFGKPYERVNQNTRIEDDCDKIPSKMTLGRQDPIRDRISDVTKEGICSDYRLKNFNQSASFNEKNYHTTAKTSNLQKQRHKTQPISIDDIARANFLVLQKDNNCIDRLDSISIATGATDSRRNSFPDLFSPSSCHSELESNFDDLDILPTKLAAHQPAPKSTQPTGQFSRLGDYSHSMIPQMAHNSNLQSSSIPKDSPFDSPLRSDSPANFSSSSSMISSDDYSRVPASQQQKVSGKILGSSSVKKFVTSMEQTKKTPVMREKAAPVRMKLRQSFEPKELTNVSEDKFSSRDRELISNRERPRKGNRAISVYSSSSSGDDVFLDSRRSLRPNMESSSVSIQDRISQMRQDSSKWKEKCQGSDSFDSSSSSPKKERPESLHERLKRLEVDSKKWEERVVESDAKQFTVSNRMNKVVGDQDANPVVVLRNRPGAGRTPQMRKSMRDSLLNCSNSPVNETRSPAMKCISKEFVKAMSEEKNIISESKEVEFIKKDVPVLKSEPKQISVPQIYAEDLSSFFDSQSSLVSSEQDKEVDIDAFNDLFLETRDVINVKKRPGRPGRSRPSQSAYNPIKALSKRHDIKSYYEESPISAAEIELRRKKRETIASHAGLAESALAGLASTEDFADAKKILRDIDDETNLPIPSYLKDFLPYKSPMLLLVKGRRHCQTRLVRPNSSSVNRGDCYILVTTGRVFVLLGEFSNIIEQNKSMELGQWIVSKKDLGYRGTADSILVIDMIKKTFKTKELEMFWNELKCETIPPIDDLDCGCAEDDEQYELKINETNAVYRVGENLLQPEESAWGKALKYELLKDSDAFVFDFGTELYYWAGKHVSLENRKKGLELVKILLQKGFDYSQCAINPMCPFICDETCPWQSESTRPDWILVAKISQNMETVLFKEKFIDWPDCTRLIQCSQGESSKISGSSVMKLLEPNELLSQESHLAHCILENRSVGRGGHWKEVKDGIVRRYEVTTHSLKTWYISEFDRTEAPAEYVGQFFSADNIVVRWEYSMLAVGRRNIGNQIREPAKYHYVYFFWQGSDSKITQQGAGALMTLELDTERGPQIRVKESQEPPVFCHLFNGKMITYEGDRLSKSLSNKLFVVRGDRAIEANLYQVPLRASSLRSRGALVLINCKMSRGWLWIGRLCPETTMEAARNCVKSIQEIVPPGLRTESKIKFNEIKEKNEPKQFWEDLNSEPWISPYSEDQLSSIRLWQLSGVTGVFTATEVHNVLQPDPDEDIISPLPFHQSVLYGVTQPALFLLDAKSVVYLWQGWIPESADSFEISKSDASNGDLNSSSASNKSFNQQTGSLQSRFDSERQAALETVQKYARARNVHRCVVVYAGLEPETFKQHFFFWEEVEEATRLNTLAGRHEQQEDEINSLITHLKSLTYPIHVLQERPLPEGVDPKKIEQYLDPEDFKNLFGITMEEFSKYPAWKQTDLRKRHGLF